MGKLCAGQLTCAAWQIKNAVRIHGGNLGKMNMCVDLLNQSIPVLTRISPLTALQGLPIFLIGTLF